MCDTMVVLPNSTADGSLIFAKNSDREPNEAHHLLAVPAADHAAGEMVQCTYIQIPQAPHTHAVLLANLSGSGARRWVPTNMAWSSAMKRSSPNCPMKRPPA